MYNLFDKKIYLRKGLSMKKNIFAFLFVFFMAQSLVLAAEYQSYLDCKVNRLVLINAVGLEPQQQKEVAAILKKYDSQDYSLLNDYLNEKSKLVSLKKGKASRKDISAQRKTVKVTQKALDNHYDAVDKEVLTVMTRYQKAQYKVVSKSFKR